LNFRRKIGNIVKLGVAEEVELVTPIQQESAPHYIVKTPCGVVMMKRQWFKGGGETNQGMSPRREVSVSALLITTICLCLFFTQAGMAATGQVNYNTTYQQLLGFGGAAVYDVTGLVNHEDSNEVYDLLFKELGIEILRIRNTYDYSTGPGDLPATATIIAAAREPQRSPNLKIELVPWSPAYYVKSNEDESDGGTLAGGPDDYVYDDYANWWYNSLGEWKSRGVEPDYISLQNEPDIETDYDSCYFAPTQNSTFAGYDQAFEAVYNKLYSQMGPNMPQMWAPCTMGFGNSIAYIEALIDIGQIDNVDGFSHHLYTDGSYDDPDGMISGMEDYAEDYGYKPLHMTEYVKLSTTPNFDMGLRFAHHIYNCLYYEGVTSFFNWTLFRGPNPNGGGIVTLTSTTDYVIRPQYWFLKHYAHFTGENWYLVDTSVSGTSSGNLRMAAFQSPDNSKLTIVITNISTSSTSLTLTVNGFSYDISEVYRSSETENWLYLGTYDSSLTLPAESITTIALSSSGPLQTLSISSTSGGSVINPGEGSFQYSQGSSATIEAEADEYYHFLVWTGTAADACDVADPCAISTAVTMDANYTIVANFEADPPDVTPPDPNPMTWASVPTATGSSSIIMTATDANDESLPVMYYFECITDSDANSGWQTDTTYIAQGLNPNTQYTFRVKARDDYLTPNETGWSDPNSATTQPPSTDVEILGSWGTGTSHTKESGTNPSRALIFIAHAEEEANINLESVTYGGQSMTKVTDEVVGTGFRAYVAAYILDEAGIAAAANDIFVPNWSTSLDDESYGSVFLENVDQTAPVGPNDTNSNTDTDNITTDALSTNDGDMVIVAATCGNTGNYTINNDFNEPNEHDMDSSTGTDGYKPAIGLDETPSVTHSNANRQVILGFVVQASEGIINMPPAAPTGLVATAGNEIVSLDWDDNNEPDLAGYNVYRAAISGGGPGGYNQLNGPLVTISEYDDDTVTNGTPYFYVVKAVDTNDLESVGYSNEDSATPDYQTCADVQAGDDGLLSDLDGDCYVDYWDLEKIVYYWLEIDCSTFSDCDGADFEPDDDVDFADFSTFGLQWLHCNDPEDPGCTKNW